MPDPSSSACSEKNMVVVDGREIEVMKGRKINQLSPLTRNLNKSTTITLKQAEIIEKRQKMISELKVKMMLKMMQKNDPLTKNMSSTEIIAKDKQAIKDFKNELKVLVVPEKEMYTHLKPNSLAFA